MPLAIACTKKRIRLYRRLFSAISLVLAWYISECYNIQSVNHYQHHQHKNNNNNNNLVASGNKDSHNDNDTNNNDDLVMVCGITAIFGTYEKTVKEPLEPLVPSFPLFLVTDQEHLLVPNSNSTASSSAWTPIRVNSSLWQEDCTKEEYVGARNNPCEQPFPFNIAKFYKMQFYRVPELQEAGCNVVIWFDATIVIKHAAFMGRMADRANNGENFVVYVQDGPRHSWKNGLVSSEVKRSIYGKYGGKQSAAFGPPQHVREQYEYYLSQGFTEGWFRNTTWFNQYKGVGNDMKYGLYITCMFMIDLRRSESKQFLECWWRENILRSTQDQVGFPYCAWKLNIKIHALPDEKDPIGSWTENPYFRKLDHGL